MISFILNDVKKAVNFECYHGVMNQEEVNELSISKSKQIYEFLGDKKFLLGDSPLYIDFQWFEHVELMDMMTKGEFLNKYPNFKKYRDNVYQLIKEFYDSDKCMKRPFNGATARINN